MRKKSLCMSYILNNMSHKLPIGCDDDDDDDDDDDSLFKNRSEF